MAVCGLIRHQLAVSIVNLPCRHINGPRWSLARLVRLAELTLSGDETGEVMLELMRSRPAAVLPTSLRVLRQDNVEDIKCLEEPR